MNDTQTPDTQTSAAPSRVVLVTGGLGGIGLALSAHLARTAKAKLVLVGRSPLPDPGATRGLRRLGTA